MTQEEKIKELEMLLDKAIKELDYYRKLWIKATAYIVKMKPLKKNKMKKTAVDFLITEIKKTDWWLIRKKIPLLIEQAKEMEKEQIINAYETELYQYKTEISAEQYYNQTYKLK
jgi:hypothetical protein